MQSSPAAAVTHVSEAEILEKARNFYGYGHWDAPYWFIGPEEGMDTSEGNSQARRVVAWQALGKPEICDCRQFHAEAGIEKHHIRTPAMVPTWRAMMRVLAALKGTPDDIAILRSYQRDRWGMAGGETCVIELSGMPAKGFHIECNRKAYRDERMKFITDKLRTHKPAFVVMYGWGNNGDYEKIIRTPTLENRFGKFPAAFARLDETRIALTTHPNTFGVTKRYWKEAGEYLRLH